MGTLLIIGSTGLVGSRLATLAGKHGFEAYNTQRSRRASFPNTVDLDITDGDATLRLVRNIHPDAIINTAAVTNVDYCETHKEEASRINVEGVKNLVKAASEKNSRLVQISTDFVFDGIRGHYRESDLPHPVQWYGQTKLDAEKVVSTLSNYAIARPSVIYGWNPPQTVSDSTKPMNFAMFVLDKLGKNETVRAVKDQYSSPTFANNLAEALLKLAARQENGIFHTAGGSCLNRYEFALKLAEVFGYETSLVQQVESGEFKQLAVRPKNSCLRIDKAEKTLGMRLLTAEEGIREMRRQSAATAA